MILPAKLNRGLALTIAVLIAVTVYLVGLSKARAAIIPDIKDACERHIDTFTSYMMLPEEYRTGQPDIPKSELDKYIEDMKMI